MARGELIYKCLYNQAAKVLSEMMKPLRFRDSVNYLASICKAPFCETSFLGGTVEISGEF